MKEQDAEIVVWSELKDQLSEPIFQVFGDETHYKIWADGRTEGFGEKPKVANLISMLLQHAILRTAHLAGNTVVSPMVISAPDGSGLFQTSPRLEPIRSAKCGTAIGEKKNE